MKGIKLDSNGDILIENNKIAMTSGNDLKIQTLKSVLNTNKGEWALNHDEGITFANVIGKNRTADEIKHELQQGAIQVDENYSVADCELEHISDRSYKAKATIEDLDNTNEIELAYE